MTNNRNESETEAREQLDLLSGSQRQPYEPPKLVYLGSFRDLTKGGGLTGLDFDQSNGRAF